MYRNTRRSQRLIRETCPYGVDYNRRPVRGYNYLEDVEDHVFIGGLNMNPRSCFYDTEFDDWKWKVGKLRKIKKPGEKRKYRMVSTGTRYRADARRVLRDEAGKRVIPNVDDPSHYGRSPER